MPVIPERLGKVEPPIKNNVLYKILHIIYTRLLLSDLLRIRRYSSQQMRSRATKRYVRRQATSRHDRRQCYVISWCQPAATHVAAYAGLVFTFSHLLF